MNNYTEYRALIILLILILPDMEDYATTVFHLTLYLNYVIIVCTYLVNVVTDEYSFFDRIWGMIPAAYIFIEVWYAGFGNDRLN